MTPKDSPAFPCEPNENSYKGLSKQDYFAAAALTGILASLANGDMVTAVRKAANEAGVDSECQIARAAFAYSISMKHISDELRKLNSITPQEPGDITEDSFGGSEAI